MITARGLSRTFGTKKAPVHAVTGVDLDVAEGELVAFLGPNGAGKSTTMRMLTTLLAPTSGSASVAGFDVTREPGKVRERLGYVGQGNGASHAQRVRDELVSQGRFFGMSTEASRTKADELIAALELTGLEKRGAGTLSGGQRRRLDVALGLMHQPSLLFLDEPSTGLDPQSRANLWQHIRRVREATGMTILLTTHYLDEADSMAERVVIIDQGRIIADDTAENLKTRHAGDTLTLGFATEAAATAATDALSRSVGTDAETLAQEGRTVRLTLDGGTRRLPRLLAELEAAGHSPESAETRRPTLDDVFLNLTGRSLREEVAA